MLSKFDTFWKISKKLPISNVFFFENLEKVPMVVDEVTFTI